MNLFFGVNTSKNIYKLGMNIQVHTLEYLLVLKCLQK
jgi:hypothetical protein